MSNEIDENTKKMEMERMQLVSKAIKFNHPEERNGINAIVNVDEEIKNYQARITKLSLPYRFGMYKPQIKNVQEVMDDETTSPDGETPSVPDGPNHKTRKIFG